MPYSISGPSVIIGMWKVQKDAIQYLNQIQTIHDNMALRLRM
jgi:hypothetical protein